MRLQTRITLMIVIIVILSAGAAMGLTMASLIHSNDRALERNLFAVADAVARLPAVRSELRGPPLNGEIQRRAQDILDSSADIDLIVVCNMRRQRYSHPNPQMIGALLVGNDEGDAIDGRRYLSVATGTLGKSIRAFVPIMGGDGNGDPQIGFIVVGTLVYRVERARGEMLMSLLVYLVSGLGVGIAGAVVLARRVKGILLGLEPEEIARLYSEHSSLLEALHEGVIAVDRAGKISMANGTAREFLGMAGRDPAGLDIGAVVPDCRLPDVVATGAALYGMEREMLGRKVIVNHVPIRDKGEIIGAVATFRDRTLAVRLAEELTGAKQLVASLRASSHEFINKLQVLLGLLDLEKYDKAKSYILDAHRRQSAVNRELMSAFRDPVVAGLVLGKSSFCREQGVRFAVTPDSGIGMIADADAVHALVTVIGNLVDNAAESARDRPGGGGEVEFTLAREDGRIVVSVRDNGAGVCPAMRDRLFRRGCSGKGAGRGMGLFLVRRELEAVGGTISFESDSGGTVFRAEIPSVDAEADDAD